MEISFSLDAPPKITAIVFDIKKLPPPFIFSFGNSGYLSYAGLCKIAKIPFASAGIFESAVFIDKYLTKLILKALEVKTAKYAYITSLQQIDKCPDIPGHKKITSAFYFQLW